MLLVELQGKTVVVGVTGGIAAYWAAEIIGALRNRNADVRVVMTKNAEKFVTPLTLRTLSENEVLTDLFKNNSSEVSHITYARRADFIIIAPATANIIGKIAHGIADDALSSMVIAAKALVIICPAMNNTMWENPIVQGSIKKLKSHECHVVDPEYGEMACKGAGIGRLASIERIMAELDKIGAGAGVK